MEIGARVENGKIIVIDGTNGERITIKANQHINLFINNSLCERFKDYTVTSNDNIEYTCDNTESDRSFEIEISEDKMQAYLKILYKPEIKYRLKDKESFINLALVAEEESSKDPIHYTVEEIKKILNDNKILYGINKEDLLLIKDISNRKILIAEGTRPIQNIPSDIKLFFNPTQMVFPTEGSTEKIDYKNLFRISNVNKGDKIAQIIPEVDGKNGKNIYGEVVKFEYIRSLPIKVFNGCIIKNNYIIANINGKAHIANRNISVNPVYSVEKINMETCNIKFIGDIEVYDSVDDNMTVKSGGSLDVSKNVNTSNVVSGGEITIIGNAINSKILSGQVDIRMKEYCDVLKSLKEIVYSIIDSIIIISSRNRQIKFNEIFKILIESKFNNFQKLCLNIISINVKNQSKHNKLIEFIKGNLLGYNILNVTEMNDLNRFANILQNEIDFYDKNIIVPLDIKFNYCQDCEIKSTGNIIISGQGEYTSDLTAMKDILFTQKTSVARGGTLNAGKNISAGVIGSPAYITTKLCVPLNGKISASYAFKNTIFCFGNKLKVLEKDYENINVIYDEKVKSIIILHSSL